MKSIYILLFLFISIDFFSQNYLLNSSTNGTTISGCSGNFYDDGGSGLGANGEYSNNANWTITFCPTNPGDKVNLLFTDFDVENGWDFMYIYDGASTSAPSLGVYSGNVTPIGNVQATASNTSGCITIRFTSDGSATYGGWRAVISCVTPCETINSVFNSSTPAPGAGNIIRVCQGASVTFNGSGTFSSGNSSGATYSWNFDNGTTGSGQTATTTYNTPGVYVVNLNINKSGCINYNKINQIVQVSTTPSFSATTTNSTSICLGQSATLIGSVTPTPFIANCTPPIAGTTFLPDGSGTSYNTCITVDCYTSSQTVTSANDIANICINMEHSYLGDLQMEIVCPNGQIVPLKTYAQGGGGTYLGNPIDNTTGGPGTGSNYCFSMSSSTQLVNGSTVNSGNPTGSSIAPGTYAPQSSFAGLVGCPLNGGWCIKITDNLAADDGYIFNWDINFTTAVPASQSFTPSIVSQTWSGANITSTSGNNAVITPTSTGTKCYTLTATDNFGCNYTTVRCVTVTPGPYAGVSNTLALCNSAPSTNLFPLLGSGVSTNGTWTGPAPALTGGNLGIFNPASLSAGTYNYTYTVPGTGACPPATAVVSITVRPNPSISLTGINPSCGLSNGTITISNTSGSGQDPFTFASSSGSISGQTVTTVPAGVTTVSITNTFGCISTSTVNLTNSPPITALALTPNNILCSSAGSGSITIGAVTGGTSPFTYAVNGGAFSPTPPVTGLGSGTYSVTVRDARGCTFSNTVSLTVTLGPTAVTGATTAAGCALSNGTYSVTSVTGGTPAYTYSINGVSTPSVITGLAGGTRTLTVRDNNGCTYTTNITIPQLVGPSAATVLTTNATCGSANGSATVSAVAGGVTPYQYSFNGGAFSTTNNTSGQGAGAYNATVMDANSCTVTVNYNISNAGSPTASILSVRNVNCNGLSNGSFTATASGGAGAPYTYTLSSPFSTNGTGQFSALPAGNYLVSVRDASNCVTTTTVEISQPTALTISPSSIPANCFGTASGTVSGIGSGGVSPYQYSLNGGTYQTSSTFTSQGAAIYNLTVRDANLCIASQTIQVTEPTALSITLSSQNANCTSSNGIASATVTGGTPIYTYSWTGGGGAGATASNLATGNYTVTATDSKGCVITGAVNVGQTPGGTAAITSSANITCNGLNNGVLTVGMTGGSAPFTYSWTPGGQSNGTASNLAPGTYTCEVTDFYGCKAYASGTITQPSVLSAIMNSNNVKCFGTSTGTVIAAGTGGTGPYTYLWPTLASTLSAVSNVPVGNYNVNITDANNCTITSSIAVTEPTQVTLSASVTAATCNQANGSATVSASGGTPLYTYTWTTGATGSTVSGLGAGTYTISVRDDNNCLQTVAATIPNSAGPTISVVSSTNVSCFGGNNGSATVQGTGGTAGPGFPIYNWSNGQNTATATNLLMGVYTVSVTDASGCVASISVNITQPPVLTVSITTTQPKCFGQTNGFGVAAAFGGTPSYTYAWTSTGGNAATSNQLGAGIYGLTVNDANGCVALSSMTLTNPAPISAAITSTNVSCFGTCNGIAVGTTSNAFGVVSYFWTGGPSAITSQTATGLCAGTYTLSATDQNNCTANNIVTITQPAQLTADITSSGTVTCPGGSNGFAVVTPGGGTPAYSYVWSGSASSNGNSSNANNLPGGTYTVTVSDTRSCTANAVVTIQAPTPLTTTLSVADPKCFGSCDGTANVAYSGGSGTTTFLWLPGLQSGNFVNNLCAGDHTVQITTNGACSTSLTFSLSQPLPLTAIATSSNSNCQQSNGKVCATTNGGTAPLSYLWSNGANTLCSNNVLAGAYTFSVTDANLCVATAVALVNDVAGPSVAVLSTTDVKCFNGNDGTATTTITGGVLPYSVSWSTNSSTSQNVSNFSAGIHNITVIDGANCIGTASLIINQPPQLVSAVAGFTNVTCFGLSNGSAEVLVNGGTPNYSYTWTPGGQTSGILANVASGTYTCQIRDINNCSSSQVVSISQPQQLVLASTTFSNISCFGGSDGQITTVVQGGTPGYTYSWTPTQTGNSGVLGGLVAGQYALTVTDSRNCLANTNFVILEPAPLTSVFTSLPARCGIANGSASVSVAGGTPNYNVVWNTSPLQSGFSANGMSPGIWNAAITDAKGCILTQTVSVSDASGPVITGFTATQPLCFGQSNGAITVNYTSGTPNYTVSWSNPISQVQQTASQSATVTGVGSGVYTATVTDTYGCVASIPVNMTQPPLVIMNTSATQTICFGSTAQIYAQGQGGTNTYTYTWSNGLNGGGPHTVNPMSNTTYNVSMVDGNGCSSAPKVITVVVTPSLALVGTTITKCHAETASLTPTLTSPGNGGSYNYIWNDGQSGSSINVTANIANTPMIYTVTVDDGCTIPGASAVFTINVNPLPVGDFTASITSGCAPANITFFASSNGSNNTFTWIKDLKDPMGTGNPLTYSFDKAQDTLDILLEITNSFGCKTTIIKNNYISLYPKPTASFFANPNPTTILEPTVYFTNTSQGAVSYLWDFGEPTAPNGTNTSILVNPNHSYATTGVFNVNLVAFSNKGCTDTAMVPVEVKPDFAIYIPNTFTPDGNGLNDMFFPLGVGIDEENYRLDIFDRWGENIFTSNNFRKGWDGSVKGGKIAPQGVYVYKLMVYDLQGNKYPFVGHVTVIRKDE